MDRLDLCRASLFWRTSLVVDRSYETVRSLIFIKQVQRKKENWKYLQGVWFCLGLTDTKNKTSGLGPMQVVIATES